MDFGIIENCLKEVDLTIIKTDIKDSSKLLNGAVFILKEGEKEIGYVYTGSIFIQHYDYTADMITDEEGNEIEVRTYNEKTYQISLNEDFSDSFEVTSDENGEVLLVLGKELQQEGSYYVTDGETVCTYELTDGKAIIHNIKATHTYSVTEIYAPDKYILDQNSYEIVIDYSNDVLLEIRLKNVKQYVLSLGF